MRRKKNAWENAKENDTQFSSLISLKNYEENKEGKLWKNFIEHFSTFQSPFSLFFFLSIFQVINCTMCVSIHT